jgi:hypothetical protein
MTLVKAAPPLATVIAVDAVVTAPVPVPVGATVLAVNAHSHAPHR